MKKISYVIPCYKSENTIKTVIDEIILTMKNNSEYNFEIILVSDNSPDEVFNIIKLEAKDKNFIKGIKLAKNFGQHAALMAGYKYATGDVIVSLDDDGQTPANEVFKLIEKLENGYDVVYASYNEKKHNIFRNLGSWVNDIMSEHLISKSKDLKVSSFFCAKSFVIEEMIKYDKPYPYLLGLVLRTTHNITDINVTHRERVFGVSNYNFKKLIGLWMNGFTAFSIKPLRIATLVGVCISFVGFIFGSYTIINKLLNPKILAGYSSIMSALLFIGGMIMLMLGLLGEYIGRIYICINNSPQYVIRETVNIEEEINDK